MSRQEVIQVGISRALLERLDEAAQRQRRPRAAIVREAVDAHLAAGAQPLVTTGLALDVIAADRDDWKEQARTLAVELDVLTRAHAAAREAVGEAWFFDGASLAVAIWRKTQTLEVAIESAPRRASR